MTTMCPMCLNTVDSLKKNSHVLPKFFLKPIRDNNGQINVVDVFKSIIDSKSQDLPKGTYICEPCEVLTSQLDGYGYKVLNQDSNINLTVMDIPFGRVTFEQIAGIDFSMFRNFLLSIAVRDHCWRKSLSMTPIMSDNDYEEMRSFLFNQDKNNDTRFRIVMHRIQPTIIANLHKTTSPPVQSGMGDAVTFMGLGYAIMVYFKTPSPPNVKAFSDMCGLNNLGIITMPKANLWDIGTWKKSEHTIRAAYQDLQRKIASKKNKRKK